MFILKKENTNKSDENLLQKKSFYNIYRNKCYDFLEKHDLGYQIDFLFRFIISIGIIFFIVYPGHTFLIFKKFFLFENMLFPKSFITFYFIFNYELIFLQLKFVKSKFIKIKKGIINKQKIEENKDKLIAGIPIIEILDHLFENKHFKRSEVEEKFGIPRNKYQQLAKKLEDIDILKRGENNSRILNEDYTREQIARAFIYADGEIDNMYMPVIQVGNYYTREGQSPTINEKINNLSIDEATA